MGNLRHREGKCLGKVSPRWERAETESWSFHFPSWRAAPTTRHSWPEWRLLYRVLPHIPRKCVFSKVTIHTHRMAPAVQPNPSYTVLVCLWNESQGPCVHKSLLSLKEKCFSTHARELGTGDRWWFKTNPGSQFCRQLVSFESQALLCVEYSGTLLQSWPWEQAEWCGLFKVLWVTSGRLPSARDHLVAKPSHLDQEVPEIQPLIHSYELNIAPL